MVNQTPDDLAGNAGNAFTASVHVADDGTVGVSYYDFRNQDPATPASETDHFLVHCHTPDPTDVDDGCADDDGWSETRITLDSFDLLVAPEARGLFLGDYVGLDNVGNAFAPVFTQSNSVADPATEYYSCVSPLASQQRAIGGSAGALSPLANPKLARRTGVRRGQDQRAG
jgi:hypothetical protein